VALFVCSLREEKCGIESMLMATACVREPRAEPLALRGGGRVKFDGSSPLIGLLGSE
jgi:hypothetical protein